MAPNLLPVSLRAECSKAAAQFDSFANPTKGLDSIIPPSILRTAAGLAILSVTRAGFLLSARAGSGVVIGRTPDGWSAPSAIGLAGIGAGLSAGVEMTEFIIILNSRAAVKSFMATGSLTIGGNISIAAGPTGRSLEATGVASTKGLASMYSYSRTKGIYGGASIEGSVIVERSDTNAKAYGFSVSAKELLSGRVDAPDFAAHLISTLSLRTGMENNWIAPDSDDEVAPSHSTASPQPYSFGSAYATGGQGGKIKSRKNSLIAESGSGNNTPSRNGIDEGEGGSDYGSSYKKDTRDRSTSLSSLANKLGRLGNNRSPSPSSVTTPSSYPANLAVNANGTRSRSGSILRGISLPSFGSQDKKSTTVTSSAEIYNETPDDVSKSYGAGMIKDYPSSTANFRQTFVREESSESEEEYERKRYGTRTPPANNNSSSKKYPDYSPPPNENEVSPFDDSAFVREKPRKLVREGERGHAMKSMDRASAAAMLTKPWDSMEDLMAPEDRAREPKPTPARKYSGGLDLTQVEVNFARSSPAASARLSPESHRTAPPPPKFNRSLSNAPKIGTGIALYDFASSEATDLSFKKGDIISVLSKEEGGEWYRGRLKLDEGIFPANYVEFHAD